MLLAGPPHTSWLDSCAKLAGLASQKPAPGAFASKALMVSRYQAPLAAALPRFGAPADESRVCIVTVLADAGRATAATTVAASAAKARRTERTGEKVKVKARLRSSHRAIGRPCPRLDP